MGFKGNRHHKKEPPVTTTAAITLGKLALPKIPDPISAHSQAVLDRLTGESSSLIGSAWLPMIDTSDPPPQWTPASGSFFGGTAACIPLWPVCLGCKTPMSLVCQIDRQSLIHPFQGVGLVLLFACCRHPISPAVWATAPREGSNVSSAAGGYPLRRIVKWLPRKDFAHPEEAGRSLDRAEWEVLAEVQIRSDKIGGFPCWLQPKQSVLCALCAAPMRLLLQVDSGDNFPVMWGKDGCVLVFECPAHPEQVHAILQ